MVAVLISHAQPDNPDNQDPFIPLTGIEYLLAAGALFGLKKLRDHKQN